MRMEKLLPVTAYDLKLDMPEAFCVAKQLHQNIEGKIPNWIKVDQDSIECTTISSDAQEVIQLISVQLSKIGPKLDLETRNIMRRGPVWVITDPYF